MSRRTPVAPPSHPRRTPASCTPPYPPAVRRTHPRLGSAVLLPRKSYLPMAEGLSTTFKVGRYTCSMTLPSEALRGGAMQIQTQWTPETPTRLTQPELQEYRRGR